MIPNTLYYIIMAQNTASTYIKAQGLPSLQYVADKANIGRVKLHRWYHNNFALFEVVVAGVWLKWAETNKEPDPSFTEEMIEKELKYLKAVRWNQ